ncbi:MAG TPA: ABC transporter permease, partial [Gemmatimonadaceae bacterium]|nr:ABC transporter permease [Gemmatimonadaceae bacterium]
MRRRRVAEYALAAATLVQVAVFSVAAPGFLSVANAVNIALSIAIIGILAVGMTAVILTGGIDLSVGSVLALAGVASAIGAAKGVPAVLVVILALGVGAATGIVNGTLIAYLRVPPFVATLATMGIARGAALLFTDGGRVQLESTGFRRLATGSVLGI